MRLYEKNVKEFVNVSLRIQISRDNKQINLQLAAYILYLSLHMHKKYC